MFVLIDIHRQPQEIHNQIAQKTVLQSLCQHVQIQLTLQETVLVQQSLAILHVELTEVLDTLECATAKLRH